MTEIKHTLSINATLETVYQALTTSHGLKSWFTPQVKGTGQTGTHWELSFTDQPFFSWQILSANHQHIAWQCLQGPGNAVGTEVEFTLKAEDQQTHLTITHQGWTEGDPKYARCVDIWRTLMQHLTLYCESGTAQAAFR